MFYLAWFHRCSCELISRCLLYSIFMRFLDRFCSLQQTSKGKSSLTFALKLRILCLRAVSCFLWSPFRLLLFIIYLSLCIEFRIVNNKGRVIINHDKYCQLPPSSFFYLRISTSRQALEPQYSMLP